MTRFRRPLTPRGRGQQPATLILSYHRRSCSCLTAQARSSDSAHSTAAPGVGGAVDDQSPWAVGERRDARPHIHLSIGSNCPRGFFFFSFLPDDDFVDLRKLFFFSLGNNLRMSVCRVKKSLPDDNHACIISIVRSSYCSQSIKTSTIYKIEFLRMEDVKNPQNKVTTTTLK